MEDRLRNRFKSEGLNEDDQLPLGHRNRFAEKLEARSDKKSKPASTKTWLGIAAGMAVLISIGVSFIDFSDSNEDYAAFQPMSLKQVSPELGKTEVFLTAELNAKKTKADSLLANNPELKGFLEQLDELETEYAELETALGQNNNNEKIIAAMIRNYRLRLEILETMFMQHQTKKRIEAQHS